ncbi:MAG TPA: hypothetical protein VGG30_06295 [Pirellulales bacterium]|jgi:hypothetical protein
MDPTALSHRQVFLLIAALLLAFVASVAGFVLYELSWIRQRRAARAEFEEWFDAAVARSTEDWVPVDRLFPPRGISYLDQLAVRALDKHWPNFTVPCPMDDAGLLAKFKDGEFPLEAIEKLEQVRRARWLFPEADVKFFYFTDADSNLIPDQARFSDAGDRSAP